MLHIRLTTIYTLSYLFLTACPMDAIIPKRLINLPEITQPTRSDWSSLKVLSSTPVTFPNYPCASFTSPFRFSFLQVIEHETLSLWVKITF